MKKYHIQTARSLLIAALLLLGISSVAFADDPLRAYAWGWPTAAETNTGTVGPVHAISDGDTVFAESSADFGVLKLYSEADKVSSARTAFAESEWNDVLLFNAPGLTGQQGFATLHYQIDGSYDVYQSGSDTDYAKFSLYIRAYDANLNISSVEDRAFAYQGDGVLTNPSFLNAPRTLSISFTYGEPLTLQFKLRTEARAYYQNGSHAVADLSHTATWEGITDIEDSSHNAVTNSSLSSDSGTNYMNPVPEPSLAAFLVEAGIFACAFVRHRPSCKVK